MKILLWDIKYVGFKKTLKQECVALVKRGLWITAVKLYRERTGATLKDAKDYIDSLKLLVISGRE